MALGRVLGTFDCGMGVDIGQKESGSREPPLWWWVDRLASVPIIGYDHGSVLFSANDAKRVGVVEFYSLREHGESCWADVHAAIDWRPPVILVGDGSEEVAEVVYFFLMLVFCHYKD